MRQWKELGQLPLSTGIAWALESEQHRYALLEPSGERWTPKVWHLTQESVQGPPLPGEVAKAWAEEALRLMEGGEHPRRVEHRMRGWTEGR